MIARFLRTGGATVRTARGLLRAALSMIQHRTLQRRTPPALHSHAPMALPNR